MKILLSGYYGFGNAGDEAVLAAILTHLSGRFNQPRFTVVSGDPNATSQMHASTAQKYFLHGVKRDDFKALAAEIKKTDLFISGGGSLLQDVTSLRNVAYHCGLLRLAQFKRKPNMMYAQGVGPLNLPLSQKLVRMATARTNAITVRDNASKVLLQNIGVKANIQVTADPVWGLEATIAEKTAIPAKGSVWCVSLRSWPGVDEQDSRMMVAANLAALRDLAMNRKATLRFLPMQAKVDDRLLISLGVSPRKWIATAGVHPARVMEQTARCDLMIGMRLHALIFAAAQQLPCVAINYDPKVAALAEDLQIPLLDRTECSQSDKLVAAIDQAKPPQTVTLNALAEAAKRNAEIAAHCRK
ncbi:MAG: polysaccharide pyruvyl transferase CsaB [Abditibacteriaceae bacterium]